MINDCLIDDCLVNLIETWEIITDDEVVFVKKSLSDIVKFNIYKMTVIRQSLCVTLAYFIDEKGEELPLKIAFKKNMYRIYNKPLNELLDLNTWLMLDIHAT